MDGIPDFGPARVLCVGDLILDRFLQGSVQRISPESPVPILLFDAARDVPGGAGNVARNIGALGAQCAVVGVIGADQAGADLRALLGDSPGVTPRLIVDQSRPTSEKIRYVAQGQHMLRVDRERQEPIGDEVAAAVLACVADEVARHDVMVLSDYAKGVLTDDLLAKVIALAREAGRPIVVDPKSARLARYRGATIVTPNVKEAASATGIEVVDDLSAERAAQQIIDEAGIESVLLTRAERGLLLFEKDRSPFHVVTSAREVFDVVGAGDTVVATLAVSLAAGLPLDASARIANAAAGIVVGKHGTATVKRIELVEEIIRLNQIGRPSPTAKILTLEMAAAQAARWREDGLTVGFTNGCFDILHIGHIGLLDFARSRCDRLVVGLNADRSVARLKGPSRPINTADDRAFLLGALSAVDAVVVFGEDTPIELIRTLEPDILVKGSDYTVAEVAGGDLVLARGGEVLLFELVPGQSSTAIINRAGARAPLVA